MKKKGPPPRLPAGDSDSRGSTRVTRNHPRIRQPGLTFHPNVTDVSQQASKETAIPYRVEELAEAAGVSVELLRSYQSKGLLPPPRHEGRVAFYGAHHLERLRTIRQLKEQGYSLRAVASLLEADQTGSEADHALESREAHEEGFDLRELAERSRVPPSMLRSLESSGVLRPRREAPDAPYTSADVRAVRHLLSLIGTGLPMEEFMRVARVELAAIDAVATEAVQLFVRYVQEPLIEGAPNEHALADAFRLMVQATSALMAYNFQRALLNAAQDAGIISSPQPPEEHQP